MRTKTCSQCKEVKPLSQFRIRQHKHNYLCWECEKVNAREYKQRQRARNKQQSWKYTDIQFLHTHYKLCPECQTMLPLAAFYKDESTKDGFKHTCNACQCARSNRWRRKHLQQVAAIMRNYRIKHAETYQATIKAYRQRPEVKEKHRQQSRRRTENLVDARVLAYLLQGTELTAQDIPHELVEAKRELIKLNRQLKQTKKETI